MGCETNLTDARKKIIAEFIEAERKRKYSLRRILNALLYVVKRGVSSDIYRRSRDHSPTAEGDGLFGGGISA